MAREAPQGRYQYGGVVRRHRATMIAGLLQPEPRNAQLCRGDCEFAAPLGLTTRMFEHWRGR